MTPNPDLLRIEFLGLTVRHEEVELSWRILDPVEEYWASLDEPLEQYDSGSWGPASADALLARDGRVWRRP